MLLPGDFGLVSIEGEVGVLIRLGQWLNGDGFRKYEHAFLYIGNGEVVEAQPGGAVISPLSKYDGRSILWSSDLIPLTADQRQTIVEAAKNDVGTPYSFLDYLAIALYRIHIKYPWVAKRVEDSKHLICSYLVAKDYKIAGWDLTSKPPYLVTPGRLSDYLDNVRWSKVLRNKLN